MSFTWHETCIKHVLNETALLYLLWDLVSQIPTGASLWSRWLWILLDRNTRYGTVSAAHNTIMHQKATRTIWWEAQNKFDSTLTTDVLSPSDQICVLHQFQTSRARPASCSNLPLHQFRCPVGEISVSCTLSGQHRARCQAAEPRSVFRVGCPDGCEGCRRWLCPT